MRSIDQLIRDEIYTNVNETMEYVCKTHGCANMSLIDEDVVMSLWQAPLQARFIDLPDGYRVREEDGGYTLNLPQDSQDGEDFPTFDTHLEAIEEAYVRAGANFEDASNVQVYEHYAVSPWLASRLLDAGEQVLEVLDFRVWCRTTTGQCVTMDAVIKGIYNEIGGLI